MLVVEPENLKFHHVPSKKKATKKKNNKTYTAKTKKADKRLFEPVWLCLCQRDIVNQAAKAVPGVIKGATNYINNIAIQRIDQIISQERKEIEHVLPKILRGAIGDVYQTPI